MTHSYNFMPLVCDKIIRSKLEIVIYILDINSISLLWISYI